jgi:hypothetical protein
MHSRNLALLLSSALFAHVAAFAGEVTLFTGPDFSGQETTLRGDVITLKNMGMNDRAMSMVVHSGRWEVCIDADYRGECRTFETGQYRNLDRFTRQISSLREIESPRGQEQGRGRWRGRVREEQAVVLFDSTDMRGRSVSLTADVNTLVSYGFNDAAQSMVVRGGSWEFCQHSDFRGQCRVFGPGEYRNLDRAFQRSISSARRVGGGRDDGRGQREGYDQRNAYEQRGGYEPRNGYDQRSGAAVELFGAQGFGGQRVQVDGEIRTLEQLNFNDRAGSMVINSGEWEFCQHSDFRGQCTVYGPGRYDQLGSLHNAISSIRRVR